MERGEFYEFISGLLENFDIAEGDSFQVLSLYPDLLHVDKFPGWKQPGSGSPGNVTLRGNIESFPIPDIVTITNMNRKTGILCFIFNNATKALYFASGEIIYASSSLSHDRLGEVLKRMGRITESHLGQWQRETRGGTQLGKYLVGKGIIAPKELFNAVRQQVEDIIYSLFLYKTGYFIFFEGAVDTEGIPRIPTNTQNIMMEGIRRIDEQALFEEKIPSGDLVLVKKANQPPRKLNPEESAVFDLIDGMSTVNDIQVIGRFKEFDLYKILYHLMVGGHVEISSGEDSGEP
jgi:hypothetical protein